MISAAAVTANVASGLAPSQAETPPMAAPPRPAMLYPACSEDMMGRP